MFQDQPLEGRTILLVEDDAIIALGEQKLLEGAGYQVLKAAKGEDAVTLALEQAPDLILMDIDLGRGMDGTEAAQRILQEKEIPIIFLTSHGEEEMVSRVDSISGYGYVLKSSGEFILLQSIKMAFRLFDRQQQLAEREQRYKTLFENEHVAVAVYQVIGEGEDFIFSAFNRGAERIDRQDRSEVLGKSIFEARPGVEKTGLVEALRRVYRTGEECFLPLFFYSDGGHLEGWYENHLYKLSDDEIVAVFSNESDRIEEAREAVKYRTLFETLGEAIFVHDPRGKILDVNKVPQGRYGYTRDELIGNSLSLFDRFMSRQEVEEIIRRVLQEERVVFETVHTTKTGEALNVAVTAALMEYEGKPAILSVCHDITRTRLVEEELRRSEQRYRSLLEATRVVTWELELENLTFSYISPRVGEVTGYSASRWKDFYFWQEVIHPEDRDFAVNYCQNETASGRDHDFEYRMVRPDGSILWIRDVVTVIRRGEAPIVLAGHFIDITEKKRQEEERNKLLLKLEESNRELQQFAYIASHDLQEPLRMISSYTQLLERKYRGNLDEKADRYIAYVVDGALRMQQLINNLLDYSRIESKGKPFTDIDLESLKERLKEEFTPPEGEAEAEILWGPMPRLKADELQMERLFRNLISNGIKFRKPGESPIIRIDAKEHDDHWLFSVEDNGIGIDRKFLDKVFIIFRRLHSRADYGGTGIGLTVCRRIVKRHGGEIWIESEPGSGTRVLFTITKHISDLEGEGGDHER